MLRLGQPVHFCPGVGPSAGKCHAALVVRVADGPTYDLVCFPGPPAGVTKAQVGYVTGCEASFVHPWDACPVMRSDEPRSIEIGSSVLF